ncbi:MAG: DUF2911 domain-containing protein [Acidobacteriota bacterium]|nr:DUF2911 domain-containing protein [Blastocatellia bacterium]MDW8240278.1 DUF2911 domain-containing protein [Acidobacteriota bacterium]
MMSHLLTRITIGCLLVSCVVFAASAFGQRQRLSPLDTAEFTLDGKKITVTYSRPSMRGRKIMGALVPYDKVWRTGANEATSFTTEADLVMGGKTIPKGSYTLYTIPSPNKWTLIINKQTGQWGTVYDESQDLARIEMKVESLQTPVEQFTISFDKSGKGGVMKLEWENTRASVEFRLK